MDPRGWSIPISGDDGINLATIWDYPPLPQMQSAPGLLDV